MRKKARIELDPNLLTAIEEFFKMKVTMRPDGKRKEMLEDPNEVNPESWTTNWRVHFKMECRSKLFLS